MFEDEFANLVLQIDGDNLLHRVYHIAKGKAADESENMGNIIAAFFRSVNAALNKDNYTHLLITWDSLNIAPSMRREILKPYGIAYKGNREHDPEIYRAKLLIQQACEAVNIPQFTSTTGYESDDLLGSFAVLLNKHYKCEIHILTSDKDLIQVVDEDIVVLHPQKGQITKTNCYNLMGLEANQIVPYLVMVGDGADGIPGVKGVGTKTAIKLLEKYGTVSNIVKNVESLDTNAKRSFLNNPIPLKVLGQCIMLNLAAISEFFDLNSPDLHNYYSTQMSIDWIRKRNISNKRTIRKTLCHINDTFGKLHGKLATLGIFDYTQDTDQL